MMKFLIIISHGSKSAEAGTEFSRIVEAVRQTSVFDRVEGAYMEFAEPRTADVINSMASLNPDMIVIVPYYLFNGIHVKRDIHAIADQMSVRYPDVKFLVSEPLGYDIVLSDIVTKRAEEVIRKSF